MSRAFAESVVEGVTVEHRRKDGSLAGSQARVIDFDAPASNRFTVSEGQHMRRPDVVLFVNALAVAAIARVPQRPDA